MDRICFVPVAVLLVAGPVLLTRADVQRPPPAPVEVRAVTTIHSGAGVPSRAVFELRNGTSDTFRLRVGSVVCLLDWRRIPLRVVSAHANGRKVRGNFQIAPRETVSLELGLTGFTERTAHLDRWVISLELLVEEPRFYGPTQGTTVVRRGPPGS